MTIKRIKHMPGPWRVEFNAPTCIIEGHLIRLCEYPYFPLALLPIGGGTEGKPLQEANARLIAAAPELLEIVEAVCKDVGIYPKDLQEKAMEILKKVEGRA